MDIQLLQGFSIFICVLCSISVIIQLVFLCYKFANLKQRKTSAIILITVISFACLAGLLLALVRYLAVATTRNRHSEHEFLAWTLLILDMLLTNVEVTCGLLMTCLSIARLRLATSLNPKQQTYGVKTCVTIAISFLLGTLYSAVFYSVRFQFVLENKTLSNITKSMSLIFLLTLCLCSVCVSVIVCSMLVNYIKKHQEKKSALLGEKTFYKKSKKIVVQNVFLLCFLSLPLFVLRLLEVFVQNSALKIAADIILFTFWFCFPIAQEPNFAFLTRSEQAGVNIKNGNSKAIGPAPKADAASKPNSSGDKALFNRNVKNCSQSETDSAINAWDNLDTRSIISVASLGSHKHRSGNDQGRSLQHDTEARCARSDEIQTCHANPKGNERHADADGNGVEETIVVDLRQESTLESNRNSEYLDSVV